MQCFNKGIELLVKLKETMQSSEQNEITSLNQQIASALCCQAELYMTDSWYFLFVRNLTVASFEDNAENECDKLLLKALEYDANNVETLTTMANFRLCQQKQGNICTCIVLIFQRGSTAIFKQVVLSMER